MITTDEALYDAIGRSHKPMTAEDQASHLESINMICEQIIYQAMLVKIVREALYQEFARRADVQWDGLAKMGRDFAAGVKGRSATIHKRIYDSFIEAAEHFRSGDAMQGAGIISRANLHPRFFVDAEAEGSVYNYLCIAAVGGPSPDQMAAQAALDKVNLLNEYRKALFNSVLNMVAETATGVMSRLQGEIVQYSDLVQEGLTAAWNATLRYQRSDTKFSSYAHFQIQGAIRNYVSDNTRTVRLPRYQVSRMAPVQEALERTGSMDFELIAKLASKVLYEQKERKLKKEEVYTAEEVEMLMTSVEDSLSLDALVSEDDETVSVADLLLTDPEQDETSFEEWMVNRGVTSYLRQNLSNMEYHVLRVRWGIDPEVTGFQGLDTAARILKERFPNKKINKSKVKEIEARAMCLLRNSKSPKLQELWEAAEENIMRSKV